MITGKKKGSLGIRCTSTDCEGNLHCFRQAKKRGEHETKGGHCCKCGADLVDWKRVHKRDMNDVEYTFRSLKYEMVRHHFWHQEMDLRALNYARRKGKQGIGLAAERRIRKAIGPADPPFDGRQTGKSGNPLFYGQHATATCCRKCIEYWHGIPQHAELSETQIGYLAKLLVMYVDDRLPNLTDEGEKVAPIRRKESDDIDSADCEE